MFLCLSFFALAFACRGGVGTEVYAIPQTLPLFDWWEVPIAVGLIWLHGQDSRPTISRRMGEDL